MNSPELFHEGAASLMQNIKYKSTKMMHDFSSSVTRNAKGYAPMMLLLGGSVSWAVEPGEVTPEQFNVVPDSGQDATPGIREAIEYCRAHHVKKLAFQPGRYDLWPERAEEHYLFVSNNDEGLKRIAFPLVDIQDLEVDGAGSTFVFHGPMVPFLLERSSGVTIQNLSFDFVRTFDSEGRVLAVNPESVDLEFAEEFPYVIRNGILLFTGPVPGPDEKTAVKREIIYPYVSLLAFDATRRETAYMAKDRGGVSGGIMAKSIGPRQVRIFLDKVSAEPGNILAFGCPREYPGFVVSDSSNVKLDALTINHCGGMGVIAQRSSDLFLNKVQVVTPVGSKRVVSITADATHFVNAKGKIEMTNCVFEGQKDDATNIHGIYSKITRKIAPDQIEVKLVHEQQFGDDFLRPGMRLELTQGPSLQPLGYAVAKEVTRLNKEYTLVKTTEPLPDTLVLGDVVADADANTADVLIKDCVFGKNRARGILLGSRGKILVEGNTFHTPGAAILFEGDARFWFEQGGVREVVIRDNTFNNCNYGVWGKACIEVGSGLANEARKTTRYNKNITIENNLFRVFDSTPLLSIYAVDGLRFRNNKLEKTEAYPASKEKRNGSFVIADSDNVDVEEPISLKRLQLPPSQS